MGLIDKDLLSIQETRHIIVKAKQAQQQLKTYSQQQIDQLVYEVAKEAEREAERLAKLANDETGFGNWPDKVIKNQFASKTVYESLKDLKTVGIIHEDKVNRVMEVAIPVGVVAGLIPSTNPTSTTIYKALIALKAGNAIVFSPHPAAKDCIVN